MIVYRFEKKGIGPYVGGVRFTSFGRPHRKPRQTKTQVKYKNYFEQQLLSGESDRLKNWRKAHSKKKYMFGCKSKEQLRAYFGGNFKVLFKNGYRIKRYYVPDDEIIDMQVEVAFPVKYHKLQTVNKIKKVRNELSVFG